MGGKDGGEVLEEAKVTQLFHSEGGGALSSPRQHLCRDSGRKKQDISCGNLSLGNMKGGGNGM